jgi:hypothetical protein
MANQTSEEKKEQGIDENKIRQKQLIYQKQ